MKYAGMPMGMWVLFAASFRRQLTAVFGYDKAAAAVLRKPQSQDTKRSSLVCRSSREKTSFG